MESTDFTWKQARAHIYNEENLNWGNVRRDAESRMNFFIHQIL